MADEARPISTFCHISEYRATGYGNLHRLIAISNPLTLWAPSSVLLTRYHEQGICQIDDRQLLRLIEAGRVKILAREEWITDRRHRQEHSFSGARWTPLDDAIKDIFDSENRGGVPEHSRRVRAASREEGSRFADEFVERHPGKVTELWQLIHGGSTAPAFRDKVAETDQAGQVKQALRDSQNHAGAFAASGADQPFLTPAVQRMLRYLNLDVAGGEPAARAEFSPSEFTRETVALLEGIEDTTRTPAYWEFLNTDANRGLTCWLRRVSDAAREIQPANLQQFLRRELKHEVEKLPSHRQRNVAAGLHGMLHAIGLPYAAAELLAASGETAARCILPTLGTILGAFASIEIAGAALEKLGWTRRRPDAKVWPYLWIYGREPTPAEQFETRRRIGASDAAHRDD